MPVSPFAISRKRAAYLGEEAVRIGGAGRYMTPSGRSVSIAESLQRAIDGTRTYPPEQDPAPDTGRAATTLVEVRNETTLAAARSLSADGFRPVALNFASATSPGGGFLGGARAQEESLARSSGLFLCLRSNPMYEWHHRRDDALYGDWTIYSPDVPVFRSDDGTLLEEPYTVSIVTSPAPNAGHLSETRHHEIGPAFRRRIAKVLATGLAHGHDAIVLGAWGCGAFHNDADMVAGLFREALTGPCQGAYARVRFAILDLSEDRRFLGPFERAFRGDTLSTASS